MGQEKETKLNNHYQTLKPFKYHWLFVELMSCYWLLYYFIYLFVKYLFHPLFCLCSKQIKGYYKLHSGENININIILKHFFLREYPFQVIWSFSIQVHVLLSTQ